MRKSAVCTALFWLLIGAGLLRSTPDGTLLRVAQAAEPITLNGEIKADGGGTETGTVTVAQSGGKSSTVWKVRLSVSGATPGARYRFLISTRNANSTPVARVVTQAVASKSGAMAVNATIKVPATSQITGGSLMRPDPSSNGYRAVAFFELK